MIYKHGNTSNYLYFIPCKTLYCLQSFINSFIMNLFLQITASTSFYAVLFLVPVEALLPLQQRAAVDGTSVKGLSRCRCLLGSGQRISEPCDGLRLLFDLPILHLKLPLQRVDGRL